MKVLFCTNTFQNIFHGPSKFANYLLELNLQDGIDIRILTEDIDMPTSQIYKASIPTSNRWKKIGMLTRTIDYYNEAERIKKEFPFDILIFNHAMIALQSARKMSEIIVIGMINDENSTSLRWGNMKWNSYYIRQFIFKYFEKWTTTKADLIIVNSEYLKSEVIDKYSMSQEDVKVLYKGIDFENIVPNRDRQLLSHKKEIQIFFMKSDPVIGGLHNLIDALGLLKDFTFNVIIVGPPQSFIENIQRYSHVHMDWRGKQVQSVVFEIMDKEADIFCVPSLKEGLGVANIEALGHYLPVVSTQVGGIPEVLDHGNNGWLALQNDVESLAVEIRKCIQSDDERVAKAKRGYIFAERKFNKANVLENYSDILKGVLEK